MNIKNKMDDKTGDISLVKPSQLSPPAKQFNVQADSFPLQIITVNPHYVDLATSSHNQLFEYFEVAVSCVVLLCSFVFGEKMFGITSLWGLIGISLLAILFSKPFVLLSGRFVVADSPLRFHRKKQHIYYSAKGIVWQVPWAEAAFWYNPSVRC